LDASLLPLRVSTAALSVPPMEPFAPSYSLQRAHQISVLGESMAVLGSLRLPTLRGDVAAAAFPTRSSPESLALRDAAHGDARDVWGARGTALAAAVDAAAAGPQWPLGGSAGAPPGGGGGGRGSGGAALPAPAAYVPPAAASAAAVGGRAACAAAGAAARERQAAAASASPLPPARGAAASSPWLRPRFHAPGAGAGGGDGGGGCAAAVRPRFHWPTGAEHVMQALRLPVLPPEPPLPPLRSGFSPRTAELLASLEAFKAGGRIMEEARAYGARNAAA
jgi:hypothetical protein